MKYFYSIFLSSVLLFVFGCEKEVEFLQDRGGVFYELNQDVGFTGRYVDYWDEEKTQLMLVRNLKLGLRHGTETTWYEDGQKRSEINWKDGEQNGLQNDWYANGQKEFEGGWKNGEWDGLSHSWYEDGQKEREANWKHGKLDGRVTWWHENGQKKYELNFKDGELVETLCCD